MNELERNGMWKGDEACANSKRERANRRYSLEGVTCQHDGCDRPACDRHHVDGNPGNNEPHNIRLLCRRHHMVEDGRLEELISGARARGPLKRKPPRECVNCEMSTSAPVRGLCPRCYQWTLKYGTSRPEHLWGRSLRADAGMPRAEWRTRRDAA